MSEFVSRIEQTILRHRLLQQGDSVLVAVSGGLDSMVLVRTLQSLSAAHGWKLAVAHFNHQLRGAESDGDERFVGRAAKKLGLPFLSTSTHVKKVAKAKGLSIEMAARALRHEFLAQAAAELGFGKIALAHHADDQVELFFIRLLRGAGTQGLGGMGWSSPSPASEGCTLLRPLLAETKTALENYARAQKISFRKDSSNLSNDIQRNRIRNQLLPLLRRNYQPQLSGVVLRSMTLIQDEGEFVTLEAIRWMESQPRHPVFDELHVGLQRRVVQIELLKAGVIPQFEHIELLRTRAREWVNVRAGLLCRRTHTGRIESKLASEAIPLASNERHVDLLQNPAHVALGLLTIQWTFVNGSRIPVRQQKEIECFDAQCVGQLVTLRNWRNGDRFQPIGMVRAVKLQDLFVNQKIPRARRHQIVIATTNAGEIFWVEGLRIGERFKVTPATRQMLRWCWR